MELSDSRTKETCDEPRYFDPPNDAKPIPCSQVDSHNNISNSSGTEGNITASTLSVEGVSNANNPSELEVTFHLPHSDGFSRERHRIHQLNEKYRTLRSLIPNPTKVDRASIVGDAIEYIKELERMVLELNMLAERKGGRKRRLLKTEDEAATTDMDS